MTKPSLEVKALSGKEGSLTDILKAYLDVKKANYSIAKSEPGENVARIKGVYPFVEPGSIIIEKNGKKFIAEQLTKVCGASGRFHERNGVNVDSILNKSSKFVLKTEKDSKDLRIYAESEIKDPTFGMYMGGGTISIDIKDALREPSNMPDSYSETYEINCECDHGKLKCKGKAWEF